MDEFQGIHNNPEGLEERVLVYAIFQPEDVTEDPKIIGGYATKDNDDFCRTIDIGEMEREVLFSHRNNEQDEWIIWIKEYEHQDALPKHCPRYFAGQYPDYGLCQSEVRKALEVHMQDIRRRERQSEQQTERQIRDYRDVHPDEMEEYVWEHYITPAVELQKAGDYNGIVEIMRSFKGFSFNPKFGQVVEDIHFMMHGEPRQDILRLYARQIAVLNREDYVSAALLRDKISDLTQKI